MKYYYQLNLIMPWVLLMVICMLPFAITYTSQPSILNENDLEYSVGTFAETRVYRSKHSESLVMFLKEHPYPFLIPSSLYSTPNNELDLSSLAVGIKIRIGHLPDPRRSVSSEFKDFILSKHTEIRTLQIADISILSLTESNKAEFESNKESKILSLIFLFISPLPLIWKLVNLKYKNK